MSAKSDVVVKLALVFFISLLSFSIGTFVGKKYSDNQHKLASLEPGEHTAGREVASIVDEGGKVEATVKDDEIAKIASEFADDDTQATKGDAGAIAEAKMNGEKGESKVEGKKEEAKAEKAEAKPEMKVTNAEVSAPAKNLVAGQAPTPTEKPAPKVENRQPSSLPRNVAAYAVGKFTVQVGSFLTESEARDRAEALKKQGYSAFYVSALVKGTQRFRVNVGLFATEKEAKNYRTEFMQEAKVDSSLVQKITN